VHGVSLESVFERIAGGEFSTLVVARLHAVAGSLREVIALLDWLDEVGARLLALDVSLDTSSAAGRRTVAVLREIARWERDPGSGRPPRGRPGLAVRAPELSGRITDLREQGLSLQAIADALNADGVPTPRGGTHWRPSSVQAALGYQRPPPGPPLPPLPHGPLGPGAPEPPPGPGQRGAQRPPLQREPGHPAGRGPRRQRKGPRP
jgi:Resolvase, N terminal domain/Recombinase